MTIKTTQNGSTNRGEEELEVRLRSLWLGMRDSAHLRSASELAPAGELDDRSPDLLTAFADLVS